MPSATAAPASAAAHYERLLAAHYTWMVGDYDAAVAAQRALLVKLGASAGGATVRRAPADAPAVAPAALDLGAGPGYQAIALAELGYSVTAVDTSALLLAELAAAAARRGDPAQGGLPVESISGDLRALCELPSVARVRAAAGYAVAVCMGDTLPHLESLAEVEQLFADVHAVLAPDGVFALTFRDLTPTVTGLDRFIPVRADADRVMMCFLEADPARSDVVVVHDLVHTRTSGPEGAGWSLSKSSYRKLRLAPAWVVERLEAAGFAVTHHGPAGQMVGIAATKR